MIQIDKRTKGKLPKILFCISDAVHNIGDFTFNRCNDLQKHNQQIGLFFTYCKTMSLKIESNAYSDKQLNEIIDFIENDFHDFCHYIKCDLDINKFIALVD